MNKSVLAAITVAINSYIEQEEQPRALPPKVAVGPEISFWRLFGRQELMRPRTRWQVRRNKR
jgi:hypothetical protein